MGNRQDTGSESHEPCYESSQPGMNLNENISDSEFPRKKSSIFLIGCNRGVIADDVENRSKFQSRSPINPRRSRTRDKDEIRGERERKGRNNIYVGNMDGLTHVIEYLRFGRSKSSLLAKLEHIRCLFISNHLSLFLLGFLLLPREKSFD